MRGRRWTVLRWLMLVPLTLGAVAATQVVMFSVAMAFLRFTGMRLEFSAVKTFTTPFMGLVLVLMATRIAPSHKLVTATAAFGCALGWGAMLTTGAFSHGLTNVNVWLLAMAAGGVLGAALAALIVARSGGQRRGLPAARQTTAIPGAQQDGFLRTHLANR